MNRKTLVLPALIGLLAPVLTACGGVIGGGENDGAIVVGTTDSFSASSETPAPFDPAHAYDSSSWNVLRQTLQTLMSIPRGGGEPEPEAAQACGFTDTGSERYACTLRKGLKFADGSPLTAEDVKYSIDRVLQVKDPGGPHGLLSAIDTVEVTGEREVVFHLKSPGDATFPYKLATPAAGIVNPDAYAKDTLRSGFEVDGSGPYTLEAKVEKNQLVKAVFTKNPHYKGALTPKSDKIELRTFGDAKTMGTSLEDGDIDVMARTMLPEQIQKLAGDAEDDLQFVEMDGLEMRYLAFDTDAPEVRNKAVRQAMAQLVDRAELTTKVYGGTKEPLYSLVPASITGHTNSFFNTYGEPSTRKARAILAKAGIKTPVKLTLHYTSDHYGAGTKEEFELLAKQLNDSGLFKAETKGTEWLKFRPAGRTGQYAVYGMGWFPDFPDADNFIAPFLDKNNFLGSPYVNKTIREQLIPESRQEADRLSAAKSVERTQDIVAEDVPVLPLWTGKQYVAAADDITGVQWALNSSSNLQLWELARGVSE